MRSTGVIGAIVGMLSIGCSAKPNAPAVPAYTLVHSQGSMERTIVVPGSVGASDADLRTIAWHFIDLSSAPRGRRAVMLQVWTDQSLAPSGDVGKMTDAELAARTAVVTINEATGFNAVERPKR